VEDLPSPYPEYEYGRCGCGGTLEPRLVEVRLTLGDEPVVLPYVPQGACSTCGSRVYKAEVLEIIEAIFYGELPLQTASEVATVIAG
jgi:YgiT-type zinc finger domain-containing protein